MSYILTVVHLTEALGGGVQSAISRFAGFLGNSDQHVLARPRSGEQTLGMPAGVKMHIYAGSNIGFYLWSRKKIRELQPEVVHLHSSSAGLMRLIIGRGPRIVYSPHCFAFERRDIPKSARVAINIAERIMGLRTDAYVAVSPHEANLCKKIAPWAEVYFVPNLVENQSERLSAKQNTVVMVGRITPQKRPELFADVARSLGGSVRFIWVGDGDLSSREYLEDSGVEVTGWLSDTEVAGILSTAGLYLHTSAWEAGPLSLAEALAYNTAIACSDQDSLRSLGYFEVGRDALQVANQVRKYFSDSEFMQEVQERTTLLRSRYTSSMVSEGLSRAYGKSS